MIVVCCCDRLAIGLRHGGNLSFFHSGELNAAPGIDLPDCLSKCDIVSEFLDIVSLFLSNLIG
jgi:hypothetical protein